jgi:hypothetical protein
LLRARRVVHMYEAALDRSAALKYKEKESPSFVQTTRALKSLVFAEATGSRVSRSFADVTDVPGGFNDELVRTFSRVKFTAAVWLKSNKQLAQMQSFV